jgi:hypothetical protein
LFRCFVGHRVDHGAHGVLETDGVELQRELTRDDSGEIEQLFDEACLCAGGFLHHVSRVLHSTAIQLVMLQKLAVHEKNGERGAKLVRQNRQESSAALACFGPKPGLDGCFALGGVISCHAPWLDRLRVPRA